MNFEYGPRARRLFARVPVVQRLDRELNFGFMEAATAGMTKHRWLTLPFRAWPGGRSARRSTIPSFAARSRRGRDRLQAADVTDHWYRTLMEPNVELVTDRIATVMPEGIRTEDGIERPADVLILGTGFETHAFVAPMEVRGPGPTLEEVWADVPRPTWASPCPASRTCSCSTGPTPTAGQAR